MNILIKTSYTTVLALLTLLVLLTLTLKMNKNMQYFMMIFNKKEYYRKLEILVQEWMGHQSLKVSILYELFKKELTL